jgi:hypothetical protein
MVIMERLRFNYCEDEGLAMGCFTCRGKCNTKVANPTQSCEGTCSAECSKLIHQSGIKEWFYLGYHVMILGFSFLLKAGVIVEHGRG